MANANNVIKLWKGAVEPGTVESNEFVENYCDYTEDLTGASWSEVNITAAVGQITADAVTNKCFLSQSVYKTSGAPVGLLVVHSGKAMAGTYDYLWVGDRGNIPALSATFDLSDGTVIDSETGVTAAITGPDGDGFYRYSIAYARTFLGTISHNVGFGSAAGSADAPVLTFAGTETLLIKETQSELSVTVAGTYTANPTGVAPVQGRYITYGTSPGGNVINAWKGAVQPTADSTPVGVPGSYINGTRVTDEGAILTVSVSNTYDPLATDVLINGTLHNSVGYMYVTYDVPTDETFINGISHASNGVRFVEISGGGNKWPEGFATADDGTMLINTASGTYLLRGIAREGDGALLINA